MNKGDDPGIQIDKDTYRSLFVKGIPSSQTYSFKKAETNWPEAVDAAETIGQINELYSSMIDETTKFFRDISAKDYIFDVRWMMPLSDKFADRMRSFSQEPKNFMLDLEKSISQEYRSAKNADQLLQQYFNYSIFYNLVLIYVRTPPQIIEVCDDLINLVSNIKSEGKTNKFLWNEKNADMDVEFYTILKNRIITGTSSFSDEQLNKISDFWKNNNNTKLTKHLLEAKKEHNKAMSSPFGSDKKRAKRDEEISIYINNLISMKDQ